MADITRKFTASAKEKFTDKFTQDELNEAVHDAVNAGSDLLLRLALAAGGSPDGTGRLPPLGRAIISTPLLAERLIDAGARTDIPLDGSNTAVMLAVSFSRFDLLKQMIEKKADINKQNSNGETALMKAVTQGKEEAVELLLAAGADTTLTRTARGGKPETALDIARKMAQNEPHPSYNIIRNLLEARLGNIPPAASKPLSYRNPVSP